MFIRRIISTTIGTTALLLGATLVTAPSAQAEPTNISSIKPHSALIDEVTLAGFTARELTGQGRDACPTYYICIWTGTDFTGYGLGITGNVVRGDGYDWRGTRWENKVHSAVNKGTVTLTFLNYLGNGRYERLGGLAPGSWLLAPGSWLLAPGSWLLAPIFAVAGQAQPKLTPSLIYS